jgi:hypothetical protein
MSQDQTPSPEPKSSKPSPSPAPAAPPSPLQQGQKLWQKVQPLLSRLVSTVIQLGKQARVGWAATQPKVQRWWETVLPKIRGVLPQAWNDKLTDWMITAGAIALLSVFFWVTTSLLFPDRPTVAKTPPAAISKNAPQAAPLDEGKLAAIQSQLAEVAAPYAPSLEADALGAPRVIDWVRANLGRQRLTVQLADLWYGLEAAQQDELADDLWKRSLKLKYSQLELADAAGQELARSPVVGSKMVVLRREL